MQLDFQSGAPIVTKHPQIVVSPCPLHPQQFSPCSFPSMMKCEPYIIVSRQQTSSTARKVPISPRARGWETSSGTFGVRGIPRTERRCFGVCVVWCSGYEGMNFSRSSVWPVPLHKWSFQLTLSRHITSLNSLQLPRYDMLQLPPESIHRLMRGNYLASCNSHSPQTPTDTYFPLHVSIRSDR